MKAAVIGVGSMGVNHARVYSELTEIDLVGVADINDVNAQKVARLRNTAAFTCLILLWTGSIGVVAVESARALL